MVLDTDHSARLWAIAFHPDGKHLLGGNNGVIRRWRLIDGKEVGKQTGVELRAISVSRDHKWIVCGTYNGASVWDGEMHKKVIDVEGTNLVWAVDVSPESTRFATGTGGGHDNASIWSITTGKRLVGPLKHDNWIAGVRFSPDGQHFATACVGKSIRIFNSHNGDNLVTIKTDIPSRVPPPLAWSSDGEQIFATSEDKKIRTFNTSTGSQLAESQMLHDGDNGVSSITPATSGNFIATYAERSIWFLDTLTLALIGPAIEDGGRIQSIAISADSSHLATGRGDGKIVIRDLGKILPDLNGPINVSICALILLASRIPSPSLTNYSGVYSRRSTTRYG